MAETERLDQFIGTLYETVLDPDAWYSAQQHLANYLSAAASHFILWDKSLNTVSFSVLTGVAQEADAAYRSYYGSIDPRLQLAMGQSPGYWLRCHKHFDERFVKRNEFYQDYLLPNGIRYLLGGKVLDSNEHAAFVALLRAPEQLPFNDADVARMRYVEGHFQRVARLHLSTHELRARAQLGAAALNSLDYALWIVTAEASIRYLNAQAESMIGAKDCMTIRQGRLRATSSRDQARLMPLIAAAAQANSSSRGGALTVERPNGHRPYQVFVVPLPAHSALAKEWQTPLALVLIANRGQRTLPAHLLVDLYGLTPAESRLAAALLEGKTPEESASAAGVSIATVRTQVRSILGKTGVRRLVELTSLLAQVPTIRAYEEDAVC